MSHSCKAYLFPPKFISLTGHLSHDIYFCFLLFSFRIPLTEDTFMIHQETVFFRSSDENVFSVIIRIRADYVDIHAPMLHAPLLYAPMLHAPLLHASMLYSSGCRKQ